MNLWYGVMPSLSRVPLSERPTSDLVAGMIWCAAFAMVALVYLGSWLIEAGFSLIGLLLLSLLILFVGVPVTGMVKLIRELRRRRQA